MQEEQQTTAPLNKPELSKANRQKEKRFFKSTPISHTIYYLLISFLLYQLVSVPLPFGEYIHGGSLTFIIFFILFVGIFATIAIRFAYKSYQEIMTPNVRIGSRHVNFKQVFKVFAVSLIAVFGFSLLSHLVVSTTENQTFLEKSINVNTAVGFVVMAVIVAPILEELIFRGLLINLIFKDNLFWLPIVVSAAVFAWFHATANIPQYLVYLVIGIILGYAYMKTGRLLTSILVHMANNLLATFGFFLSLSLLDEVLIVAAEIVVIGGLLWFAEKVGLNGENNPQELNV